MYTRGANGFNGATYDLLMIVRHARNFFSTAGQACTRDHISPRLAARSTRTSLIIVVLQYACHLHLLLSLCLSAFVQPNGRCSSLHPVNCGNDINHHVRSWWPSTLYRLISRAPSGAAKSIRLTVTPYYRPIDFAGPKKQCFGNNSASNPNQLGPNMADVHNQGASLTSTTFRKFWLQSAK